jgi:tetratricopeptide (TPR) repeat protein
MKKVMLLFAAVLFILSSFAQDLKVVAAYNYYRDEMPDKAKEAIDDAIKHESTMNEAKTWFYRGNVYLQLDHIANYIDPLQKGMKEDDLLRIFGEAKKIRRAKEYDNGSKYYFQYDLIVYLQDDSVMHWEYPNEEKYQKIIEGINPLEIAYESYQKAIKLDEDQNLAVINMVPSNPMQGLTAVGQRYFNTGVDNYNRKNYEKSLYNFENAVKVYKALGKDNNDLIYYTAVSAIYEEDTTKAIKYFQQLVDNGYKQERAYTFLINLYDEVDEFEKALAVAKKGRELFPESSNLLLMETNLYFKRGKTDEANQLLQEAVKMQPDNESLYFSIGVNLDRMVNDTTKSDEVRENAFVEGIKAYEKAIELKPDYELALFNIGAMLNNKAVEVFNKARNLDLSETEEYEKLIAEGRAYLKQALPHLEKAHELNPEDKDTMTLLRGIYLELKMNEKLKEISDKLRN